MPNEQQVLCPKCKEVITKGAKKCPHCHSDIRNWFIKHPIISAIIFIPLLSAFISGLTGSHQKERVDLSSYETISENANNGFKNISIYTTEKRPEELIKINDKLVNDNLGFDRLFITYFDDKAIGKDYFSKIMDSSITEAEKDRMFTHFIASYKSTLNELDINKDSSWVKIKNY